MVPLDTTPPLTRSAELVLSASPFGVSQIPTWSERPVKVAPLCVNAYVPVSWQTGLTYCSVQSQTPAMSRCVSATHATVKLTCVVRPAVTSACRAFGPLSAQLEASPDRTRVWLPVLMPARVRVPFAGMRRAVAPSRAMAYPSGPRSTPVVVTATWISPLLGPGMSLQAAASAKNRNATTSPRSAMAGSPASLPLVAFIVRLLAPCHLPHPSPQRTLTARSQFRADPSRDRDGTVTPAVTAPRAS